MLEKARASKLERWQYIEEVRREVREVRRERKLLVEITCGGGEEVDGRRGEGKN